MSQTRNYGDTGASQGGGSIYCTGSSKEGQFKISKEAIGSVLTGYMDDFQVLREEGNPEEDIAPGWKVRITLSTKDDKRGTDDGSGVKIAQYLMEFSMVSQSATSAFLNVVAATDMSWDGYLRLAWYKPENYKNHRLSVYTSKQQSNQNRPPLLRAFLNNDTHMFEGIPRGRVIGQDPTSGADILDYREAQNAWLEVAVSVAKRYGQTVIPVGPKAAGRFYGKDGYWGEGIATTATPAAAPSDFLGKFKTALQNKILAAQTQEGLNAIVALVEGHKPPSMTWDDIQQEINDVLAKHPTMFKWKFNATLKTFYSGDPIIPSDGENHNDLPF